MIRNNDCIYLQAFSEYQLRRNFSPTTVRCRQAVFAAFVEYLAPRSILVATTEDVEAWLATRRLGPQGRYSYISHLHSLYRFAIRRGLTTNDPTATIDRPRLPKRIPRPITPAELDEALEAAGTRMRAWLFLGAYAGLRRAEIANLPREDVLDELDPPMLRVSRGKGNKDAVVPLHPDVLAALRVYGLPRSGPMFLHPDGRPVSPAYVGDAVAAFLRRIGIDRTCHSTRHHFGTQVYKACRDLLMTRDLMRHSSAVASEGYVAYDAGPAADVVGKIGQ